MKSEKNLGINIDPQEPILSIFDTFRAIWALRKKRHPVLWDPGELLGDHLRLEREKQGGWCIFAPKSWKKSEKIFFCKKNKKSHLYPKHIRGRVPNSAAPSQTVLPKFSVWFWIFSWPPWYHQIEGLSCINVSQTLRCRISGLLRS